MESESPSRAILSDVPRLSCSLTEMANSVQGNCSSVSTSHSKAVPPLTETITLRGPNSCPGKPRGDVVGGEMSSVKRCMSLEESCNIRGVVEGGGEPDIESSPSRLIVKVEFEVETMGSDKSIPC